MRRNIEQSATGYKLNGYSIIIGAFSGNTDLVVVRSACVFIKSCVKLKNYKHLEDKFGNE